MHYAQEALCRVFPLDPDPWSERRVWNLLLLLAGGLTLAVLAGIAAGRR